MSDDFMEPGGEDDAVVEDFTPIKLPPIIGGADATVPDVAKLDAGPGMASAEAEGWQYPALENGWVTGHQVQEVLDPEPEAAVEAIVLNAPPASIMLKVRPDQLQVGDLLRMTRSGSGAIRWQVIDSVSPPAQDGGEVQITFIRPNSEEGAAVLEASVMLEIARPLTVMQVPHAEGSKLRRWWQKITGRKS